MQTAVTFYSESEHIFCEDFCAVLKYWVWRFQDGGWNLKWLTGMKVMHASFAFDPKSIHCLGLTVFWWLFWKKKHEILSLFKMAVNSNMAVELAWANRGSFLLLFNSVVVDKFHFLLGSADRKWNKWKMKHPNKVRLKLSKSFTIRISDFMFLFTKKWIKL